MQKVPLIVTCMDKMLSSPNDKLVGYIKINLASAYSLLLSQIQDHKLDSTMLNSPNMFILQDKYMELFSVRDSANKGYLHVSLGIGTLEQINTYNQIH